MKSLGFGLLFGKKKRHENVTLGSGRDFFLTLYKLNNHLNTHGHVNTFLHELILKMIGRGRPPTLPLGVFMFVYLACFI